MADWPYPRVIAHRGGGTLAPENTLAALAAAARCGCRGVEFDARLSAEGTPFLIHDATLDRTTTGRGLVSGATNAVLRALHAGRGYGPEFAGEPLPTLAEAIARCLELGLWANIEMKAEDGDEDACGSAVARVVEQAWRGLPPLLSSFSTIALAAARRIAPELPRALLVGRLAGDWRTQARQLGCVAVHTKASRTSPADIAAVGEAGLALACYTVDDPEAARRLFAAGVNALFTDRPDRLQPVFGASGAVPARAN